MRAWVRWALVATVSGVLFGSTIGLLGTGAAAASPANTPGCNVVVSAENGAHNAVQLAINLAHPGGTVCVRPGTYPEQITISTPGLRLIGSGVATIFRPTVVTPNTYDYDSAAHPHAALSSLTPAAAIVLVNNTTGVTIGGIEIDGTGGASSFTSCSVGYYGVDFQNSSGSLVSTTISSVAMPPALFGCQTGTGLSVYAYNGYFDSGFVPSPSHLVTITRTSIVHYQKNGVTCDDRGLNCTVSLDRIQGIGPTPLTAANGIQIAYGAVGHLVGDLVTGNAYNGTTAGLNWYGTGYEASGILLYQAGAGTAVRDCRLVSDALGIAAYQDSSDVISGNVIVNSEAYSIVENGVPSTVAIIHDNTIRNPAFAAVGILVDNGTFHLYRNLIAHVSATGSQGASQPVTGPGTLYPTSPVDSVATAAIQAVSEGGATTVYLGSTMFVLVNSRLATLSVFGGGVNILL